MTKSGVGLNFRSAIILSSHTFERLTLRGIDGAYCQVVQNRTRNFGQVGSPFGEKGYRYLYAVHTHQSATHGHVLLCLSNGRERLRLQKPQLIMLRQHQVEVAKKFGWEMQAMRFQDRDFSLTGFIAPTKKKTLMERQVPHQCVRRM